MNWAKKPYRAGSQLMFFAPAETFVAWTGEAPRKEHVRFTLYGFQKLAKKIPKYKLWGHEDTPFIRVPKNDADMVPRVLDELVKKAAPEATSRPAKSDPKLTVYEGTKQGFGHMIRREFESAADHAFDREREGAGLEIEGKPAVLWRCAEARVGVDDTGCLFTDARLESWPAKQEKVVATFDIATTLVASYIKSAAKQLKDVDGTSVAALAALVKSDPIAIVGTKNKSASSAGVRDGGVVVRLPRGRYEVRTASTKSGERWCRFARVSG